jgi:hypothetical protein
VNALSVALSHQCSRVDIHSPLINGWEAKAPHILNRRHAGSLKGWGITLTQMLSVPHPDCQNVLSGALSQQRIRVGIHSPLTNGWEAATRQPASVLPQGWGVVFPVCASPLNARRNLNK